MNLRLILPLTLAFSACQSGDQPTYAKAPVYETLHHSKHNGAFFQFEYQGDRYLACSIHQAHLKTGDLLERKDDSEPVKVGRMVHKQKDLHVWTFDHPSPKAEHLLKYEPNIRLQVDDRIYFLNKGKRIAARVLAPPQGAQFRHQYQTDEPFAASGLSGSPVYLPRTGSVIGVLQTANDRKRATFGGFEVLKLN